MDTGSLPETLRQLGDDGWILALIGVGVTLLTITIFNLLRGARTRGEADARIARLTEVAERVTAQQAEIAGRVEQGQISVNARLDGLTRRLGEGLIEQTERTGATLRGLHERLAVIDAAQKNIAQLSTQVTGLQEVLSNKQARGAFGEVQLQDIVSGMLPPSAYEFQATLGNGRRVDCLLQLPAPPGPMAVDAKFPLESYRALREAENEPARVRAARSLTTDVGKHVRDIQERYIIPNETADSALMFLPSEAVYAELHANFANVIEDAFRRKVWIVSPTTLWATLNTVRAVLRDVRLREQAGVIQAELQALLTDVGRLDDRVGKLQRHFEQANEDVRQIRISTEKVLGRADRLDLSSLNEPKTTTATSAIEPPIRAAGE
jgi:DNA recombination protein RmuC